MTTAAKLSSSLSAGGCSGSGEAEVNRMLVKCETKSNRVKGLSFHPKLNWVLASLHNGTIQLWDYRIGYIIDKFEEHEGPVRGVNFHPTQPLFVSGGDDYKIKVWNYKQRRTVFSLLGHLDYIRTVVFHNEYPWILSASDDQTARIWNWQSRGCIAVLTGHNHYVMCAQFHPKDDLVVSASLDQTVRVWDISGLREKTVSIGGGSSIPTIGGGGHNGVMGGLPHAHATDVFGTNDAVVKYVLEGHDRGVNWAAFHPTLPLIVSGADDRLIKLWRMSETKAWEVDTLRGHFNNVSCVVFHPKKDLIISNSEDRTIRVWDASKRTAIHTFRRDNDRFWILAAHPTANILAVGHDSGMVVFKLDRERVAAQGFGNNAIVHVKDKFVNLYDLNVDSCTCLAPIRRPPNAMVTGVRELTVNVLNPTELNVLVFYRANGTADATGSVLDGCGGQPIGSYDLLIFNGYSDGSNNNTGGAGTNSSSNVSTNTKSGSGRSVAFVARNRFAVLDKSGNIEIMNLNNDLSKRIDPSSALSTTASSMPSGGAGATSSSAAHNVLVEQIFPAGNNRLLLKTNEERVVLFDVATRKAVGEAPCASGLRYVLWSADQQHVALLCKHNILLSDAKLKNCVGIHENIRVKSGAWDEHNVFIYSTLSHVKYCLPSGDHGILHSLPYPIYILRVCRQQLVYIDREENVVKEKINSAEYLFKLALHRRQFGQVGAFIRNGKLCGNAIIGYLKRKGHPEVALKFVEDPKTRFNLALEFGNIDEALTAANTLNEPSCWQTLGKEAFRQGNIPIVEMVYQRTKSFERLSFLYMLLGNITNLKKMLKIAEVRGDVMSRFHNALLLGDIEERVKLLAEVGQTPLAALTARAHGLEDLAKPLEASLPGLDIEAKLAEVLSSSSSEAASYLLVPPVQVGRATNPKSSRDDTQATNSSWPLLRSPKEILDRLLQLDSNSKADNAHIDPSAVEYTTVGNDNDRNESKLSTETTQWDLRRRDVIAPHAEDDELQEFGEGWGDINLGQDDDVGGGDFENSNSSCREDDSLRLSQSQRNNLSAKNISASSSSSAKVIPRGEAPAARWISDQPMISTLVAAGDFGTALDTLRKRIGLVNAQPLQNLFLQAYQASWTSMPGLPLLPDIRFPLLKNGNLRDKNDSPTNLFTCDTLMEILREGHRFTTQGQFQEALNTFKRGLQCVILVNALNDEEETRLESSIEICREYVRAMRMDRTRKKLDPYEVGRGVELACYLTCCRLQPAHALLATRMAMTTAFRAGNYITAAAFAKSILQGQLSGGNSKALLKEGAEQATKCLTVCNQRGNDAYNVNFDVKEGFNSVICAESMSVIPVGEARATCPFCGAVSKAEFNGSLCSTCDLSQIGMKTLGIQHRSLLLASS